MIKWKLDYTDDVIYIFVIETISIANTHVLLGNSFLNFSHVIRAPQEILNRKHLA